ncbi:hypothetical protein ACFYOG_16500 [Streptomyces sp. NPDC007818]|uniref:hypothetical protein n=1 Tax=Streptomyces sp. NPDC007818 TaxID=3364780 RepID=UPI0036C36A08
MQQSVGDQPLNGLRPDLRGGARALAVREVGVAVERALVESEAAGLSSFESPEPAIIRDGPVVGPPGIPLLVRLAGLHRRVLGVGLGQKTPVRGDGLDETVVGSILLSDEVSELRDRTPKVAYETRAPLSLPSPTGPSSRRASLAAPVTWTCRASSSYAAPIACVPAWYSGLPGRYVVLSVVTAETPSVSATRWRPGSSFWS